MMETMENRRRSTYYNVVEYYDPIDVTEVRCTGCTSTSVPVVNECAYRVLMQAVDPASVICDPSFCQLTSDVLA